MPKGLLDTSAQVVQITPEESVSLMELLNNEITIHAIKCAGTHMLSKNE